MSRLIGIALTLATFLAARLPYATPSKRVAVVSALGVVTTGNFVAHLIGMAPLFAFRTWQVAILLGYVAALLAGLTAAVSPIAYRKALTVWGGVAGALLLTEAFIGGPADFSPTAGKVEWQGATVQDSVLGPRFAPNSIVKTFYPDNPRGYFDEPDALQRRWVALSQEGSAAQLEFPPEKRGVMRVHITAAPGKTAWHVSVTQAPIRVLAEERYEVRFRARADSVRTIFVAVSLNHAPWTSLGLYRELRVDSTWREYSQTFRATGTDRVSRLHFDVGGDGKSVELANVVMRRISANQIVQAEARRELSVSYRINSQGCRGAEYPQHANPGAWRILSLGDGNTFGIGVHEGDTYSSRLESLLNETGVSRGPQDHYDVINCGVKGASTQQEARLFNAVGSYYAPNVVLLAVNPDDDRFTTEDEEQANDARVGKLERLFHVWGILSSLGAPKPAPTDYGSIIAGVKQIDGDVRAHGARLAVVLFQHREGADWASLDSAVTKGLRGSNIPLLNLGRPLLSFGEEKLLVHSVHDHHPNELAHRIAAEALRKFLADQGMLGQARATGAAVVDTATTRR